MFLRRRFGARLDPRTLEDAKLVATELVNNAFIHGEGRITLRASVLDDAVRVEVVDEGTGNAPAIREQARDEDAGGRGLRIVDTVATRWGTFEGTTHVWADIPLRSRGPD